MQLRLRTTLKNTRRTQTKTARTERWSDFLRFSAILAASFDHVPEHWRRSTAGSPQQKHG